MAVVRLDIAYDGTNFRGLAPNRDVRTVVGELVKVLEPILGFAPNMVMSGRTDAGVHARAQALSFEVPDAQVVDLARLKKSANSRLGPEVVVIEASFAADDFSARFSAVGRTYRYKVLNSTIPDPFLAATSWRVPAVLDVAAMNKAAEAIVGEHDFSSFCRLPKHADGEPPASLVRRVDSAHWSPAEAELLDGSLLHFEIAGSAFCHQMVRSLVGFLVAVGSGKRSAEDLGETLKAKDRAVAEQLAPPKRFDPISGRVLIERGPHKTKISAPYLLR